MTVVVKTQALTKTYPSNSGDVLALKDLSLCIETGEYIAIMGASGSGKSTVLNLLGLLDRPSSGSYWLNGEDTAQFAPNRRSDMRGSKIGLVFQRFNLLPRCTAMENVALPLLYAGVGVKECRRRATEALELTELTHRATHWPNQMSGGEQQRVAIARAIVNHPSLILADEPTGSLDSATGQSILRMFRSINNDGRTVVIVTHDESVARQASRIIRLHDGALLTDTNTRCFDNGRGSSFPSATFAVS